MYERLKIHHEPGITHGMPPTERFGFFADGIRVESESNKAIQLDNGAVEYFPFLKIIRKDNESTQLSDTHNRLFAIFSLNEHVSIDIATLARLVWPYQNDENKRDASVHVAVGNLRRKLNNNNILQIQSDGRFYRIGEPDIEKGFKRSETEQLVRALSGRRLKQYKIVESVDERVPTVQVNGRWVNLNEREFSIFQKLLSNRNTVVRHDEISALWGESGGKTSSVRSEISRLRRKIGAGIVDSIEAEGYILRAEEELASY